LPVSAKVNVVAIGADRRLEDAFCLPLGELREPLGALRFAEAVVLVSGEATDQLEAWRAFLNGNFPELPVFIARRSWSGWNGEPIPDEGEKIGAFCAIAAPERFLHDLEKNVCPPVFFRTFADHHEYSESDIDDLIGLRSRAGASTLVTTEKDWAKVSESFRARQESVRVARIHYELPEQFWYFLQDRLELA
jgi:tetraacyldisaccharide 4'-kinase